MTSVRYKRSGDIATITMDDGKVNALSTTMLADLGLAFDRAETDEVIVVLTGREGIFSAGFELGVLAEAGREAASMLRAGFELAYRVLSYRRPVIVACTGHAVAMGAFLLLAGDYRLGVERADHKYTANEVAIGLTMPHAAITICRSALTPAASRRAMDLAAIFTPEAALTAGFIDELVAPELLLTRAHEYALRLASLDPHAHVGTKLRTRSATLAQLREAIESDAAEFSANGPPLTGSVTAKLTPQR